MDWIRLGITPGRHSGGTTTSRPMTWTCSASKACSPLAKSAHPASGDASQVAEGASRRVSRWPATLRIRHGRRPIYLHAGERGGGSTGPRGGRPCAGRRVVGHQPRGVGEAHRAQVVGHDCQAGVGQPADRRAARAPRRDPGRRRNGWPAILDRETWEQVSAYLNNSSRSTGTRTGTYPLVGVLTCALVR